MKKSVFMRLPRPQKCSSPVSRSVGNTKDHPKRMVFLCLPELSRTLEGSSVSASLRSAQSRRPPDVVRRLALERIQGNLSPFYCIFGHSRTFGRSGNHRIRVGTGGNQNQVETGNEHYDNLNYTKKGKLRRVNPKYRLRWNKNNVPVWHTYTRFALLSPKVTKAEWSEGTQSWLRCGAFARIRALRFQNRLDGGR